MLLQHRGYKPVNAPLQGLYGIMHSCVTTYNPRALNHSACMAYIALAVALIYVMDGLQPTYMM